MGVHPIPIHVPVPSVGDARVSSRAAPPVGGVSLPARSPPDYPAVVLPAFTTTGVTLKAVEPSVWFLDYSLVLQMDAIVFAIFRRRLEHDATANSAETAFTSSFGKLRSPLSTVCSVFSGACTSMPSIIRRAQAERAPGLFICKVAPDAGPREFEGSTWYEFISSKALLQFEFHGLQCRSQSPTSGVLFCPLVPVRAFMVTFGPAGTLRRKSDTRREKKFNLDAFTIPLSDGKVGALPIQLARASPLAPPRSQLPHGAPADAAPPARSLEPFKGFPKPSFPTRWNRVLFEKLASFYPVKEVSEIAIEAVSESGFNSGYTGDRNKRVSATNMISEPAKLDSIRVRLREEVAAGRVAGPFERCPFPNEWCPSQGKNVPLGQALKFKFLPDSDEFRLVSDFSFGEPHSTNNHCWNPRLVDCSLQAAQISALIARCGKDAQAFTVDQKKAFRKQMIYLSDLHLFVYQVSETEFYVDLAHPFGHITSEFCFHSITAVIQWATAFVGVATPESPVSNFVDNWFMFTSKQDESFPRRTQLLESVLTDLGADIHEQQRGTKFNGLGWDWDTSSMTFTCPSDKLAHYRNQALKWSADGSKSSSVSTKRVQKITGTLNFLSLAAPCLKAVIGLFKQLERKAENRKSRSVTLTFVALNALKWLATFLATWTGSGSISLPFSPRERWQSLFRSDASSDWGYGVVIYPQCQGVTGQWSERDHEAARRSDVADGKAMDDDSSTVIELMAVEAGLIRFGQALRGQRVQIELDSQTAILDLRSWSGGRPGILTVVNRVWSLLISFEITARFEHILREFNQVADALSKNLLPQARSLFNGEFGAELVVAVVDRDQVSCL